MSSSPADRNLLFGVLALQADLVTRDRLVEAMNAWVVEKGTPLAEILVRQGSLTAEDRELLEPLVARHLFRHGGNAQRSLAAVSSLSPSARAALALVPDRDVQASLMALPRPEAAPHRAAEDPRPAMDSTFVPRQAGGLRYRVLRPHARGGLGEVFVAADEEVGREVALKEILPHVADDPESRARFLLEAEVTAGLEHPGVVPVYGLGAYADGRPFYAMRFVKGDSLKEAIEKYHSPGGVSGSATERNLALRGLLKRFVDVCETVAYAHSRGVLHRDLKPGNVMVGRYGETLVVDWGLAKVTGRSDPAPGGAGTRGDTAEEPAEAPIRPSSAGGGSSATRTGRAVGTPAYMSPEQAAGRLSELGPASDVYGLGATLYHLLTGRPPVAGDDAGEVLRKVQRGAIDKPRDIAPGVPKALEAVCLKAMSLRPADRYASAKRLAEDIEHFLADEPVSAMAESAAQRAGRWARKHRGATAAAAAAMLVVTAVAVLAAALVAGYADMEREARLDADREKGKALRLAGRNAELAQAEAAARAKADAERQTAENQTRRAIAAEDESRRRLVHSYVARGVAELDAGLPLAALPWFAEALRRERADPRAERPHRVRLAATVAACAALDASFVTDFLGYDGAAFSGDGCLLVVRSEGRVRVYETEGWHVLAVIPPMRAADHAADFWSGPGAEALSPWLRAWRGLSLPMEDALSDWIGGDWDASVALAERLAGRLAGRSVGLVHAAFGPDNRTLATLGENGRVRLWDARTGIPSARDFRTTSPTGPGDDEPEPLYGGHVAFSRDGKRLLADIDLPQPEGDGDARRRLFVWDVTSGSPVAQQADVPGQTYFGPAPAFSTDGERVIVFRGDSHPGVWSVWHLGTDRTSEIRESDDVSPLGIAPDGGHFLAKFPDGVRLVRVGTGEPASPPLRGLSSPIGAAVFSPDGRRVAYEAPDGVAVWDVATGEPVGRATGVRSAWRLAFSPDGTRLAVARQDRLVRVTDVASGEPVVPDFAAPGDVGGLAFSAGGDRLIASVAGQALVWDLAAGANRRVRLGGYGFGLGEPAFHPASGLMAIPGAGEVFLVGLDGTPPEAKVFSLQKPVMVSCVALSPDGRSLAAAAGNSVRVWDVASGRPVTPELAHARRADEPDGPYGLGAVFFVAFHPGGDRLLSATRREAAVWDVATGARLATIRPGSKARAAGDIGYAAFSPDGRRVVCGGFHPVFYDASSGALTAEADSGEDPLGSLGLGWMDRDSGATLAAFSPDGRVFVNCTGYDRAAGWDAATGERRFELSHSERVNAVALSKDGRLVATAGEDSLARAWSAATGEPVTPGLRHPAPVESVAFGPASDTLLSGCEAGARLWDAGTGEPLTPWLRHGGVASGDVWLSADGSRVVTRDVVEGVDGVEFSVWEVGPDGREREDLLLAAEMLSGARVDRLGGLERLTGEEIHRAFVRLSTARGGPTRPARRGTPEAVVAVPAEGLPRGGSGAPPSKPLASAAWMASYSADGARVVVSRAGHPGGLRLIEPGSDSAKELTSDGLDASWRPRPGGAIAYTRREGGEEQVWLVDPGGGEPRRVGEGGYPHWSGDGRTLFYHSRKRLAVMALDVDEAGGPAGESRVAVADCWSYYPAVSPDGSRAAYGAGDELTVVRVGSGETLRRVSLPGWRGVLPAWSPDGRLVAFGEYGTDRADGLWVLDVETGAIALAADGPATKPAWSPDGTRLAFDVRGQDRYEVRVVEAAVIRARLAGNGLPDPVEAPRP